MDCTHYGSCGYAAKTSMMSFIHKILRPLLAHLPKRQRGSDDRPARDWLIVLVLSGLIIIGTVTYSAFLYYTLVHTEVSVDTSEAPSSVFLNRTELAETVERYRTRTIRFETLRSASGAAPDPGSFSPKVETDESLEVRS